MAEKQSQKTILVVEDEASLLEALTDKLTGMGFKILTAQNGLEGKKLALEKQPDLILLDIIMPYMDGLTMLSELRQSPWGSRVPVIILTNVSDPQQARQAGSLGVENFFIKSDWKIADVAEKIKNELND